MQGNDHTVNMKVKYPGEKDYEFIVKFIGDPSLLPKKAGWWRWTVLILLIAFMCYCSYRYQSKINRQRDIESHDTMTMDVEGAYNY